MRTPTDVTKLAQDNLTDRQYTIWAMSQSGMSQRAIAYHLDLSRTTITDTLDAAWRKLRQHGIHVTPDGHPYLEENP